MSSAPSPTLSSVVVKRRRTALTSPPVTQPGFGSPAFSTMQTSQSRHCIGSPFQPPGQPTGAWSMSGSIVFARGAASGAALNVSAHASTAQVARTAFIGGVVGRSGCEGELAAPVLVLAPDLDKDVEHGGRR